MYAAIAEAFTITLGFALIQRFKTYPAATTVVLSVALVTLIFAIGAVVEWQLVGGLCESDGKAFFPHAYCTGLASY
jgi:hypothetical protein